MDKKRIVLEQTRLGMEFDRAAYVAECTSEEIEALKGDEFFQRQLAAQSAILERDLLTKLNSCMEINTSFGNSTEVRWMLERINNKRWGKGEGKGVKAKGSLDDEGKFSIEVSFVEPRANEEED